MAKPNSTENSSTCRISPCAKAPTTVSGMMCRMKSTDLLRLGLLGEVGDGMRIGRRAAEARARLDHVADDEADHQREGRDDLEIDQRLDADAADLLGVLDMGDAGDHGAEDDRRDHHLDQLDEAVADRLDPLVGGEASATASRPWRRARWRSAPGRREPCTTAWRRSVRPVRRAIVVVVIVSLPLKTSRASQDQLGRLCQWNAPVWCALPAAIDDPAYRRHQRSAQRVLDHRGRNERRDADQPGLIAPRPMP